MGDFMEHDFKNFERWIYRNLSIDLTAYKPKQLQRRILSIMKRTGFSNLVDFSYAIQRDSKIRTQFLDYITINVTEFFRNKAMFENLESNIRERLIPNYSRINIWSAACSNGAEPYSMALIFHRLHWNGSISILATDIDNNILERARQGVFSQSEIKNISSKDLIRYFKEEQGRFYIRDPFKKDILFKRHDLILDSYGYGFHLILCRNVVIYFNNEIKNKIYKRFYESLVPGGLLFIGATETIYNYRELGFEKVAAFLYQKKR